MEGTKNNKQQSTSSRQYVGGTEEQKEVMEVIPYVPDLNYGGAAAPDCQKIPPPLLGQKIPPKCSINKRDVSKPNSINMG